MQIKPVNVMFDHQIVVNQEFGGVSRYFVSMATQLEKYQVRARFVAPLYHNHYLAGIPSKYVLGQHVAASPLARRLAHAAATIAIPIMSRIDRPDIMHETYYSGHRLSPRDLPTVLTIYDMIHEIYPEYFPNDMTAIYKKKALDRANTIICISENTRRDLIRIYPETESRSVVTYLGFSPEFVIRNNYGVSKPYLLYVGPRGGYKNFEGLLAAFARSRTLKRDFEIVCVGGGDFSSEEIDSIREGGCEGLVRQVAAHDEELRQLYAAAAAFIYPSLYEGFGIPPLEAMAADCPVVTIRASSIPEVCGDAAQYAEAIDIEALRIAIEAVVLSPKRSAELVERGRRQIRRFSWEKCAMETAKIYRDLV